MEEVDTAVNCGTLRFQRVSRLFKNPLRLD
jgi:hypothetical protein